jgi:hypothetical protein
VDREEEERLREEAVRILMQATKCSRCGKEGKAVWECESKEHEE